MELSFIDLVSYGLSLHAEYSQIDFGMYAAFVGMGPSIFSAALVPGYTAVTPLGSGTKQEQGAGSVDLEARHVLWWFFFVWLTVKVWFLRKCLFCWATAQPY